MLDGPTTRLLAMAIGSDDHDRIRPIEAQYAAGASLATAHRGRRMVGVLGFENADGRTVVKHIATEPHLRRTGIGSALLARLAARFPNDPVVAETDHESVGFYRSLGFCIRSLGEKYPGVERFDVMARESALRCTRCD